MNTAESEDNFAQQAAEERDRIHEQDALGYFWRGIPLQPWSARRELLFLALHSVLLQDPLYAEMNSLDHLTVIDEKIRQLIGQHELQVVASHGGLDVPIRAEIGTSNVINYTRFQPDAACVLWLAHHTPDQWSSLRADLPAWIDTIMDWAEKHIAADELAHAVRLAHTLRMAHKQLVTLPRPDATSKRRDAGN